MTAPEESAFRLRLAEDLLERARRIGDGDTATAVLLARGAIENAAKAALGCLATVARSHEPADLFRAALAEHDFPDSLRAEALALLPRLVPYGAQAHAQTSYGDEAKHLLPSEMFDPAQVASAREIAQTTLDLTKRLRRAVFGG